VKYGCTTEGLALLVWALRSAPSSEAVWGYALYIAQRGEKHRDAKVLRGFGGAGVVEVVEDFRGDTFRAVYTVRFADALYVSHAFQKKSKSGRETPWRGVQLIHQHLRQADEIQKGRKS
jgi:phage-related protein